ncbi:TIGR03936 family radical SAM-associated protein [Janibacter sp. GXQ6167]|uniref:TIGR03936 family radical SAM-associated protein n=1 Tax=Janibacter sp. GXQ6167 TaxID=3240791 RepID=UPI0035256333
MARQRTPDGPPPPPPVQKLRIRYAKRGRLRFSSTRDFSRALERALRRADIPMAYSAGFHPHPKISYANGAPTGTASEAEYFEISVAERVEPDDVRAALDDALPEGIDIVTVIEAPPGALADLLQASHWQITLPGTTTEQIEPAISAFLAAEEVEVTRMFKRGPRTFDARGAVARLRVDEDAETGCAILDMVVRHTTPAVRPDDVLSAIAATAPFAPPVTPQVTRLAQGPWDDDTATVADPLASGITIVGP